MLRFFAYGVLGCSPCYPAPSSEHTVPFFYAVLFIKRRQSPTLRKNALSYTHPCTVSSNARNAMQPRRKERSSAKCAAATLCLPISACRIPSESFALIVFTSVLYILQYTLCAKAMHNISAYIEPCMTSKKSFGNPQIPLSPGPVFRCFQKIAKTRGFDPIFQEIGRFPLPPDNTFLCRRPQFFGGGFSRFFLL